MEVESKLYNKILCLETFEVLETSIINSKLRWERESQSGNLVGEQVEALEEQRGIATPLEEHQRLA